MSYRRPRYVICGSRNWPEEHLELITRVIAVQLPTRAIVITGGARGVDRFAHREAKRLGFETIEVMPDWIKDGARAALIRNIKMLEMGIELVIAFNWHQSAGTSFTVREARKRDIDVMEITEESVNDTEAI